MAVSMDRGFAEWFSGQGKQPKDRFLESIGTQLLFRVQDQKRDDIDRAKIETALRALFRDLVQHVHALIITSRWQKPLEKFDAHSTAPGTKLRELLEGHLCPLLAKGDQGFVAGCSKVFKFVALSDKVPPAPIEEEEEDVPEIRAISKVDKGKSAVHKEPLKRFHAENALKDAILAVRVPTATEKAQARDAQVKERAFRAIALGIAGVIDDVRAWVGIPQEDIDSDAGTALAAAAGSQLAARLVEEDKLAYIVSRRQTDFVLIRTLTQL